MLNPQTTLNCKGQLLDLSKPLVMGILNVTPDSFYDGGKYKSDGAIATQIGKMLEEGANIIDIGGMSSRPGADIITTNEEIDRVMPAISYIQQHYPSAIISIDTVHAVVARTAVEGGASIINDISAGRIDADLYTTVADLGVPYVLMHMQGKPKDMQQQPQYKDVVQEVLDFLIAELGKLRSLGVKDIIIDPGFGFGKSLTHNYQLLKKMHIFNILDLPILCGVSRKSMIYKLLNTKPEHALNGTTALHMIALQQGAKILRVHDVKQAVETIQLWEQLENV
ncbi:MAG: dihydropteroate synthase [Saprospiraceae bacterium]|nr:dihydropteroate synthase [Saprospiraceae bacterium]